MKPPTSEAIEAFDSAFLEILRRRHPGVRWTIDRPGQRSELNPAAAGGQVVRSLTAPEHRDPILDRQHAA
jgi:hypothetical protein